MLRLAHRILSQEQPFLTDRGTEEVLMPIWRSAKRNLPRVPLIIADNVAVFENDKRRDAGSREDAMLLRDYPPSPPAFSQFFIEWQSPETTFCYEKTYARSEIGLLQAGCFVTTSQVETDFKPIFDHTNEDIEKTHWQFISYGFVTLTNGLVAPFSISEWLLDSGGCFISDRSLPVQQNAKILGGGNPLDAITQSTLAFMQCKNVTKLDVTKEEGPSPKWCRRQRLPELKYHALLIDPNLGNSKHGERKTVGDRSGKALHICRGHYAHFVDDGVSKGLFGRGQFGWFWKPSCSRGSPDNGKVISTYEVKTPA